jgi:hypothetical protein
MLIVEANWGSFIDPNFINVANVMKPLNQCWTCFLYNQLWNVRSKVQLFEVRIWTPPMNLNVFYHSSCASQSIGCIFSKYFNTNYHIMAITNIFWHEQKITTLQHSYKLYVFPNIILKQLHTRHKHIKPPKIVITSIIFPQLIFLVML